MEPGNSCTKPVLRPATNQFSAAASTADKVEQREFQRTRGDEAMKRNSQPLTDGLHAAIVVIEPALVILTDNFRIEINIALAFDIVKHHRAIKVKSQFLRIEHLEKHDL